MIIFLAIAYFVKRHRRFYILLSLGIIFAFTLAIPKLLDYQTTFNYLPQTDQYQFKINKIYSDSNAGEVIITAPDKLKNYAIQLYNLPKNQPLLLNAIYETSLTIQPNRAKATFTKLNPRLTHLVNRRIGTANIKEPLKLIQAPNSLMTTRNNISNYFQGHYFQNADLMSALSVGLTHLLDQSTWDLLRQTGTIHLVAISGLHLTFIALWCFIILKTLLGFCMIQKPAPYQIAAVISLIIAIGYALLAGMSLPTQRALIMFAIFMIALLIRYPILNFQSLATALLIILVLSPFSVVTIGFWLSFTAVLILMLLSQYRFSFIISLLLTQLIISTLAIPIVASFFNEISLISPVANLFAIPWTTLLILPFLLIGLLILPISSSIGNTLLQLSDHNITTLLNFLRVMNQIPYSHIEVPYISLLTAVLITVLSLLLIKKTYWKYRLCYGFGIILTIIHTFKPNHDEYLLALPVGEGLSVLLKSHDQTLLFDTGPYFRGFDSAEITTLPTLKNINIQALDNIILSHDNQQHIGGTKTIRKAYPNAQMITHPSLQPLFNQSANCQEYYFQSNQLIIEPLNTQKSCAFQITLHDQKIWLIANITTSEWLKVLYKNDKPNVVLFPNKGRSHGYKIPKGWDDVILISSTKKIHANNQRHNMYNAYYGAIKVNISPTQLQLQSAQDTANFWWFNPSVTNQQ
ncbi:DNA internalization-related competence protein ComEC/Rec2 [Wohlfahrtiimonas larvae]|uniref:DNA internalization-related competence protein ComEC/Rec2 n=1 Tax=Wohlfahrtiimonas larvae TaxID=1157986 RepID=UPI0031E7C097